MKTQVNFLIVIISSEYLPSEFGGVTWIFHLWEVTEGIGRVANLPIRFVIG